MKALSVGAVGALLWCLALPPVAGTSPTGFVRLVRTLPRAYVPGRTLTVLLESGDLVVHREFYADVYETIPEGWVVVDSDRSGMTFDEATRTIHWRLQDTHGVLIGLYWQFTLRYDVTPPSDRAEDVSFEGHWCYAYSRTPPCVLVGTAGDSTMLGHVGVTRRVPQDYATIRAAVGASLFGDTVLVSPRRGSRYIEDVELKQGVDLVGDCSDCRPVLQGTEYAIRAAPHTRIQGLNIGWAWVGIYADRNVEISDCLIAWTCSAAIDVGRGDSSVRNCRIIGVAGGGGTPLASGRAMGWRFPTASLPGSKAVL